MGGWADLLSGIWYLVGWVGTIHSAHEEADMEEYSLTFGAHLLLWGFPLVLTILVIVENALDARKAEDRR